MAPSEPHTRTLTNTDRDFYPLLGPFLSRREVVRSVGGTIWDDDNKTWIIALDPQGAVTGFIAVTATGAVESLYTTPAHTDLRPHLVAQAVTTAGADRELHATVSHSRADAYLKAGFHVISETVNFTKLRRTPKA